MGSTRIGFKNHEVSEGMPRKVPLPLLIHICPGPSHLPWHVAAVIGSLQALHYSCVMLYKKIKLYLLVLSFFMETGPPILTFLHLVFSPSNLLFSWLHWWIIMEKAYPWHRGAQVRYLISELVLPQLCLLAFASTTIWVMSTLCGKVFIYCFNFFNGDRILQISYLFLNGFL